eukprot:TRINITY_DN473_c0_g1_i1.p1 TRINITY_DN473_c0_g1~~TRINITY_DN473_c0_g1_i1.p1  ORF type:complete len:330 (-),score=66.96 TRINITY_DN473_c0_g1_i1:26-922(-)
MKGLLEILSNASEYEQLTVRHKEDKVLRKLAAHLPVKLHQPDYNSTATKANILLQAHFSRRKLSPDLASDQKFVIAQASKLLSAMVDVISSNGWLSPALACMELSQMVVQAIWSTDHPFKQLPHFSQELIEKIVKTKPHLETVFDLIDMDDAERNDLLGMTKFELSDVARVAHRYPNIEMTVDLKDPESKNVHVNVRLERELSEEGLGPVHAPFFSKEKPESWWIVIGDVKKNHLDAIKRITIGKEVNVELEFVAQDVGDKDYTVYLMCDSYAGCDQEQEIKVRIPESGKDDDEAIKS